MENEELTGCTRLPCDYELSEALKEVTPFQIAEICKAMASPSSNNIPKWQRMGLRPSNFALNARCIIFELRNSEKNGDDKLTVLNAFLCNFYEELYLATAFSLPFPEHFALLLHGIELLKEEIEMVEAMESEDEEEEKQQLDLNDPIVNHDRQPGNPTRFKLAASFIFEPLPPLVLNLKPLESYMIEMKQMPFSQPIWKNGRILWTPELHARFVVCLHELGGPEVAKPKPITETMLVEGLSADQVKSHLQKYRQTWKSEREDAVEELREVRVKWGELIVHLMSTSQISP